MIRHLAAYIVQLTIFVAFQVRALTSSPVAADTAIHGFPHVYTACVRACVRACMRACVRGVCVCACVCACVCVCVCVSLHACVCVCVSACMRVCECIVCTLHTNRPTTRACYLPMCCSSDRRVRNQHLN